MSATTSFPNPEPPPLLFGSPPFSPRSPPHPQTSTSPHSIAVMEQPEEDVEMTTSIVLPAQNHDRQYDVMEDDGEVAQHAVEVEDGTNPGNDQVLRYDDLPADAMQVDINPNPLAEPRLESQDRPAQSTARLEHPTPNSVAAPGTSEGISEHVASQISPPPVVLPSDMDGARSGSEESQVPSDPASETMPPPRRGSQRSDDSSSDSDDDDDILQWQEVIEDLSVPDDDELKEIEASNERSATDDAYWKKRAFVALSDPEYIPEASGSITWIIDKLNGTREVPNTELMMESESVEIGDHKFRIKLYPNSVDESRYLSVFLTCDSMVDRKASKTDRLNSRLESRSKKKKKSKRALEAAEKQDKDEQAEETGQEGKETSQEWQHTPLPLLDPKRISKRPSVAAQFLIIMYNPEEPRSHYHMTFSHRFCPGAPDQGTMHFGFSKSDAAIRRRNQRQPIYRNDKLAFRAHVRLIKDETGCLWERSSRENPYDSLMITGLQGISSSTFGLSGGNVISAISMWMLLMPFREMLYSVSSPNPLAPFGQRPKPMLLALQKILYSLRTRPEGVGNGPFALEDLLDAFEWYAMDKATDKYDTIEIWEILRYKIEQELEDTPFKDSLDRLFGPKRDRTSGVPCYKVPVRGMGTMQKAIESTENLVNPHFDAPQILTLELERYIFDDKKRSWSKISEKLKLDENVTVCGQEYKLFGFIVHKENAQSGSYYSVIRPDGPNGKWYMYTDNRDENKVLCLTRKAAVDAHEGTMKKANNEHASVAYVVTYLRADVAQTAFDVNNEPEWNVPDWLVEEVKREREELVYSNVFDLQPNAASANDSQVPAPEAAEKPAPEVKEYEFTIINSRVFDQHEGPGLIDLYSPKWKSSEHIFTVQLRGDADPRSMQAEVARRIGNVSDPRQCKLWIVGAYEGTQWRPNLRTIGRKEISGGSTEFDIDWTVNELVLRNPDHCLWLHVIDEKDLPPLPTTPPTEAKQAETVPAVDNHTPNDESLDPPANIAGTGPLSLPEDPDSPMGGTLDEIMPVQSGISIEDGNPPNIVDEILRAEGLVIGSMPPTDVANVSMNEAEPTSLFPVVDVLNLVTPGSAPADLLPRDTSKDFGSVAHRPDETYFFLKIFDPKACTLISRGSHFVERSARIDKTIYKLLGVDKQTKRLDFYEEDDIASVRLLTSRTTFSREDLVNGSIIIVQDQISDEAKANLTGEGLFAEPQAYLHALSEERTFPAMASGNFRLDYFSAEYFSGSLLYHMPHGQGKKIYHNADVFTGSFVIGQRHGLGSMVFANGDTYEGQWVNGLQQGQGTSIELETGNRYEGNWKAGKKYGEGVTYWKMAQEEQRSCKICWEMEADAVFVDCGHVVSCLGCAKQVRDCPICRRNVSKAIKLYLVA